MSAEAAWQQTSGTPWSLTRAIFYSLMVHVLAFLLLFLSDFVPIRTPPRNPVISFGPGGLTISAGSPIQPKKPLEPLGVDRKLAPVNATPPAPLMPLATPVTTPKVEPKRIERPPLPPPKTEVKAAAPAKETVPLPPPKTTRKRTVASKEILATPTPDTRLPSLEPDDGKTDKGSPRAPGAFSALPALNPAAPNGPRIQPKGSPNGGGGLPGAGIQAEAGVSLPSPYLLEAVQRIQSNFVYPGTVDKRLVTAALCKVEFHVLLDGRITDIAVSQSSGDPSLDVYAVRALENTASLGPLAEYLGRNSGRTYVTFAVGFVFGGRTPTN